MASNTTASLAPSLLLASAVLSCDREGPATSPVEDADTRSGSVVSASHSQSSRTSGSFNQTDGSVQKEYDAMSKADNNVSASMSSRPVNTDVVQRSTLKIESIALEAMNVNSGMSREHLGHGSLSQELFVTLMEQYWKHVSFSAVYQTEVDQSQCLQTFVCCISSTWFGTFSHLAEGFYYQGLARLSQVNVGSSLECLCAYVLKLECEILMSHQFSHCCFQTLETIKTLLQDSQKYVGRRRLEHIRAVLASLALACQANGVINHIELEPVSFLSRGRLFGQLIYLLTTWRDLLTDIRFFLSDPLASLDRIFQGEASLIAALTIDPNATKAEESILIHLAIQSTLVGLYKCICHQSSFLPDLIEQRMVCAIDALTKILCNTDHCLQLQHLLQYCRVKTIQRLIRLQSFFSGSANAKISRSIYQIQNELQRLSVTSALAKMYFKRSLVIVPSKF